MATIAEQLLGQASQAVTQTPDLTGSIAKGAQLAQGVEQIKNQRAQIEQAKQELQMQKANSITDTLKIAAQSKDPRLKKFLLSKVMPAKVKALGMDQFFTPDSMEMIQTSDEALQKVLGLQLDLDAKIRSGEISGAEAYQQAQAILSNPEELAMLDTDQLFAAQEFAKSEVGKSYRAQQVAEAAAARADEARNEAGQVELAKKVAGKYSDYSAAGGKAGMESSLKNLEEAAVALETGVVKTGGLTTKIPGFKSDAVQSEINPKLVEVRTQAQAALNTVLRATLGAQFTEQEGVRILNQIWDDKLPPAANAKKVRTKIAELRANVKNAEAEFQRFRYPLQGAKSAVPAPATAPTTKQDSKVSDFATQYGMTYDQALQVLMKRGYKPAGGK